MPRQPNNQNETKGPSIFLDGESTLQDLAESLIPNFHPELATANIFYFWREKAGSENGMPVLGKATKASDFHRLIAMKYTHNPDEAGPDFNIEVAHDTWQSLPDTARRALMDHLLETCTGEEDEKTGEMKWKIRKPEVREFATILHRHGVWNENLDGFVQVAQELRSDTVDAATAVRVREGEPDNGNDYNDDRSFYSS